MGRLATLGTTFVLAVAAATAWAVRAHHDDALTRASSLYGPRIAILKRLAADRMPPAPFVAWLGDSTILDVSAQGSYPTMLASRFQAPPPWIVGHFGFEPFAYYFLVDEVLERGPRAIVLVANLRLLSDRTTRPMTHVAERLPADRLPAAALLPLYAGGWTMPRLLLARLWREEWAAGAILFLDGLRDLWQQSDAWIFAGPLSLPGGPALVSYAHALDHALRAWDAPIGPGTPAVRMLGAC